MHRIFLLFFSYQTLPDLEVRPRFYLFRISIRDPSVYHDFVLSLSLHPPPPNLAYWVTIVVMRSP